ncbi:uncharacterized protein LOC111641635 [Centruroides sculpturatus]|uniref:uncharacterized protein LOC111641635 n=1 Tax=Centruroides sculpturatus TaxID=218467 RepID=UPI000C6CE722|nr:uncharacterized protein LOC111641635 [Centruroides sculpturatus]
MMENNTYSIKYPISKKDKYDFQLTSLFLGGVEKNADDYVKSAKVLRLVYYFNDYSKLERSKVEKWQNLFLNLIESSNFQYITVDRYTSITIEQELLAVVRRIFPRIPITMLAIAIFSMLTCLYNSWIESKPWTGIIALISGGMSLASSFGLIMYFDTPFVVPAGTVPFLIIVRPVNPAKSQQILDSLQSLVGMFRHPQESFTKITLFLYYTILKQCRFDVLAARGKIVEAEKHISIFFLRESSMAQSSLSTSFSSIFRQSSPGTSLLAPSTGCLPPYYHYVPEMSSSGVGSRFQFAPNAYNCPSLIPEWTSDHTTTTERDQTDSENSNLGLPGLIYGSLPVNYQAACSSTSSTLVAIDRSNNVLSLET